MKDAIVFTQFAIYQSQSFKITQCIEDKYPGKSDYRNCWRRCLPWNCLCPRGPLCRPGSYYLYLFYLWILHVIISILSNTPLINSLQGAPPHCTCTTDY
eukprot:sb/3478739/